MKFRSNLPKISVKTLLRKLLVFTLDILLEIPFGTQFREPTFFGNTSSGSQVGSFGSPDILIKKCRIFQNFLQHILKEFIHNILEKLFQRPLKKSFYSIFFLYSSLIYPKPNTRTKRFLAIPPKVFHIFRKSTEKIDSL